MDLCSACEKNPKMKSRRLCHSCYLERRKYQYYQKGGNKGKNRYGKGNCIHCGKEIKLNKKTQKYYLNCSRMILKIGNNSTNNYELGSNGRIYLVHRKIAEDKLGRKLSYSEVIHHINCDHKDNRLDNLIVISRNQHGRLHHFIKEQRALIEKSIGEQDENCWKTLIAQMTTTWLETANVKVKKLSEIGQSAAEPL